MNIEELRKEIDNLDDQILDSLILRKKLIKDISKIKKNLNKVEDIEREQQILKKVEEVAKNNDLDQNFVGNLFKSILENSKKVQNETINKN